MGKHEHGIYHTILLTANRTTCSIGVMSYADIKYLLYTNRLLMYEDRNTIMENPDGFTSGWRATGVGSWKPGGIMGPCGRTACENPPIAEETAEPSISWMAKMF